MAMAYSMDYSNSCRLCLTNEDRLLPIFESAPSADGMVPLNDRIMACLSIMVSEIDQLPKQICHKCKCQVNLCYYFKSECEVSQRKLTRWYRTLPCTPYQRVYAEECANSTELILLKEEPGDTVFHDEHYINHCENLGSDQIDNRYEVDKDRCSNKHYVDYKEQSNNVIYSTGGHHDETDSLNLVITATTSVQEEEYSIHHLKGSCNENNLEENRKNVLNEIFDRTEAATDESRIGSEKSHGNDEVLIGSQSPRESVVEVYCKDINDDAPTDRNEKSISPDFIPMEIFGAPTGVRRGSLTVCEALGDFKEESVRHVDEPKLTESLKESSNSDSLGTKEISSGIIDQGNFALQPSLSVAHLQSKASRLSANSNAASGNKFKSVAKPFLKSEKLPVYHLKNIDLPKMNNEVLDENTKHCKICDKSFMNSSLWRHMKKYHMEKNPFECGGCHKIFSGRRELVTHRVRTVSKYCRAGKLPEIDYSCITVYGKARTGEKGRYECRDCNQKFRQLRSAQSHTRVHSGEKPFFCYKCNKKEFRLRKSANKHVAVCTGKSDNPSVISKQKIFPSSKIVSKVLKRKVVKPITSKDKLHKCKKCGKVFTNGIGHANHLRVECVRKCYSCSKTVSSRIFYKHFRQCLKSPKNQISNGIRKSTQPKTITNSEVNADSTNLKKVQDSDSNQTVPVDSERKNMRALEVVDVPLKELFDSHRKKDRTLSLECKLCERNLGSQKSMETHLLRHCGKAFKCQPCGLLYRLRSSYDDHMLKSHGGCPGTKNEDQSFKKGDSKLSSIGSTRQKPTIKFPGFKLSKLKCEICMKLFSSVSTLKFHKLTHKKIKCQKCEITFPATMEKTHICTPKVKIPSDHDQSEHKNTHASELHSVQYTCHLCKKKFHTRKMLYQHKKMHIRVKIYQCQMCGNSYSDAEALKQHKEEVHALKPATSLLASESSENCSLQENDDVMFGANKEENSDGQFLQCTECHLMCSGKESLEGHMKSHGITSETPTAIQKPQNPGIFFCSFCDKSFESKSSFIRHKGWHSRQKSILELTLCSVKPVSPSTSENTIVTLDKKPEQGNCGVSTSTSFECEVCTKKFLTIRNLRIHMFYHSKEKMAAVEPGSSLVTSQSSVSKREGNSKNFDDGSLISSHMDSHMANTDNNSSTQADASKENKQVQVLLYCKLCKKEYKCKKSLKYHMMGHSGEKPYKCKSCSNRYSNPDALAKHEKERHKPILRPFSCNRCKTSFILKEDLLAHHEKWTH